jgi:hypothetical protein
LLTLSSFSFGASPLSLLTAPKSLAKTGQAVGANSGMDGQKCLAGKRYELTAREGTWGPVRVLSSDEKRLGQSGRLAEVRGALLSEGETSKLHWADLLCSDAAFTPILEVGKLSAGFDELSGAIGDWSQDLCGEAQLVLAARRKKFYYFFSFKLSNHFELAYDCEKTAPQSEADCAKRNQCLKTWFAEAAHLKKLKEAVPQVLGSMIFKPF